MAAVFVALTAWLAAAASAADLLEHGLVGWVVEGSKDYEEQGERVPVWTFADGVVRCSGRGFGYLRRDESYADFRLELEYRFPKNGNSGIGIRTVPFTGPLETRPSQAAYEIQLLSDAGDKPGRGSCCSLYGHEAPTKNVSRPVGEWNAIVVECRGPQIRIGHNGREVLDFDQSTRKDTARKPLAGSICLQNHGSLVEFRGIRMTDLSAAATPQIKVRRVESMPRLPAPLSVIDWRDTARRYYEVAFDPRAEGTGLPAVTLAADGRHFGFDPYLIPERKRDSRGEAHACVLGVAGANLVGLDMTRLHGTDWVGSTIEWFDEASGIWANRPGSGKAIGHVVYEYWPLVIGSLMAAGFQKHEGFQAALLRQADTLVGMAKAFGFPDRLDLDKDYALTDGGWQVRPRRIDSNRGNAAALAWAVYAAHTRRPEPVYLAVAKESIAWWLRNPGRYEVTHLPGPLVAARLNAEHGCDFDLERVLTIWFGDYEAYVPTLPAYQVMPWGVTADSNLDGLTCDGLDGARMRHAPANGFYAFSMGSYHGPAWLLPAVRYDQRLARSVARYCLHAAASCRYFLGIDLDWNHQDHKDWRDSLPEGKGSLFSYEGLRWEPFWTDVEHAFRPYATGDVVALFSKRYDRARASAYWEDKKSFSSRSDNIAIYMGNSIGFLGAVYQSTDVSGIIAWDLNATDHFARASHPTLLLYNPYREPKRVTLQVGCSPCDVYDTVAGTFLFCNASGPQAVTLAPDQAAVFVLVPTGGTPRREGGRLFVGDVIIDYHARNMD